MSVYREGPTALTVRIITMTSSTDKVHRNNSKGIILMFGVTGRGWDDDGLVSSAPAIGRRKAAPFLVAAKVEAV